jgi:lipoprotein-anchoring transpeptidase ErfK/SrfK
MSLFSQVPFFVSYRSRFSSIARPSLVIAPVIILGALIFSPHSAVAQALYAEPKVNVFDFHNLTTGSTSSLPRAKPVVIQGIGPNDAETISAAPTKNKPVQVAEAKVSPARSQLGGGFIEMVLTGRDPKRAHANSYYNQPSESLTEKVMRAPVAQRRSLAHNVPDDDLNDPMEQPRTSRRHMAAVDPSPEDYRPVQKAIAVEFQRQIVDYDGPHKTGTIVINTGSKHLYFVQTDGKALRYGIGVGRPGFEWAGSKTITRKSEWPDWTPPSEMLKRRPDLPRFMEGGPENPLGARAMYLGSSLYRIHGTNEPHTIGQAVSSGCIRMLNKDVIDLYGRVKVGTRVVVVRS